MERPPPALRGAWLLPGAMVVLSAPLEAATSWPQLTRAEQAVIECTLSGLSVAEIAAQRRVSKKTVSAQRCSAYRKLGVQSRGQLAALSASERPRRR